MGFRVWGLGFGTNPWKPLGLRKAILKRALEKLEHRLHDAAWLNQGCGLGFRV